MKAFNFLEYMLSAVCWTRGMPVAIEAEESLLHEARRGGEERTCFPGWSPGSTELPGRNLSRVLTKCDCDEGQNGQRITT